jgi:curved DNA-binding protein CbpA
VQNHYETLGVSPYADKVVIAAAYKALMRKYHPDTSVESDAKERAAAINEAYRILSDDALRTAYDRETELNPKREKQHNSNHSATEIVSGRRVYSFNKAPDWVWFVVVAIAIPIVIYAYDGGRGSSPEDYVYEDSIAEGTMTEAEVPATSRMGWYRDNDAIAEGTTADPTNIPPLPSLKYEGPLPESPLEFEDIESASQEFARVLNRSGISGARVYSVACHEAAQRIRTWSKQDFCTAFDYAAHYTDVAVSRENGTIPNSYFAFAADNQADRYKHLTTLTYAVSARLSRIRTSIRPSILEAMSEAINRAPTNPSNQIAEDIDLSRQ